MTNRILHIIDTSGAGGAETVFSMLASSFNDSNYDSIALIKKGDGWLKGKLTQLGIPFFEAECKGSFNVKYLNVIRKLVLKERIDLIHAHLLGASLYAGLVGILTQTPVIATIHGKVDLSNSERFLRIKLSLINRLSAKIVFVSDTLRDFAITQFPFSTLKASVIYNGVEEPKCISKSEARGRLGWPDQSFIFGALGNVRKPKNYPNLINALAKLRAQGIEAKVYIAGDNENALAEDCNALVSQLGLEEHCFFCGFVDDTGTFLSALDSFVISSSSEGLPLSLIQAMLVGLPIVSTRCGVEEFLSHREEGYLVSNQDSTALSSGMEELFRDGRLRSTIAEKAQQTSRAKYAYNQMTEAYKDLYRSVLNNQRAS